MKSMHFMLFMSVGGWFMQWMCYDLHGNHVELLESHILSLSDELDMQSYFFSLIFSD